jgi:hypothetical protein
MKKIILAVIISIVGFTANIEAKGFTTRTYSMQTIATNYRGLYAGNLEKIKNYCVGKDTKHILGWFVDSYDPDNEMTFSYLYYSYLDLQLLTALDKNAKKDETYFKVLEEAALYNSNIVDVFMYYTEKGLLE